MLFTIGSRVRLKSTGDSGKITEFIDDGLVRVALDNGLGTIPVPTEALLAERSAADADSSGGARFISGKATKNTEIEPAAVDVGYTILQPWGVQLAFDPVYRLDGDPQRYRVYLVNDTGQALIFSAKLLLGKQLMWQRIGQLGGTAYFELGDLQHQELNQAAAIDLEVRAKKEGGTGLAHQHSLKIKPKQFFKHFITAPLLNRKVYHFVLFQKLREDGPPPSPKKEDLATYTKRVAQQAGKATQKNLRSRVSATPDPARLAAFPRAIDLHIEKLLDDPSSLPARQYLGFQLSQGRRYLQEARQLGLDSVFLIHGVGEGKLKTALASMLKEMPGVASFRNDFHPRYGSGATEVFFR